MSNPNNQGTQKQPPTISFADIYLIKLGEEEIYKVEPLKGQSIQLLGKTQVQKENPTLDYLKVVQSINDHTKITVGIKNLTSEIRDKYLNMVGDKTELLVQYNPASPKTLFRGVVTKIDVKLEGSLYYLLINGLSWTYLLDIKKKSRSFSKPNLTYKELFNQISEQYPNVVVSDNASNGTQLGGLVLQYQETDWQFLRRIAAGFGAGLAVNVNSEKPNFSIGLPEAGEPIKITIDQYNLLSSIDKNTRDYFYTYEDETQLRYKLMTAKFLNIGSSVDLILPVFSKSGDKTSQPQSLSLSVLRSVGTLTQGNDFRWEHILTLAEGLIKQWYPLRKIIGRSLEGIVLDRIHDKALVQLEIDNIYDGAAKKQYAPIRPYSEEKYLEEFYYFRCATPYTAEGNTGCYCMPEIGDTVKVYFPSEYVHEAYITHSFRINSGDVNEQPYLKVTQPSVKIFRTKYGKEIRFDPNELTITIQKYVPAQKEQKGRVESEELITFKLNDNDGVTLISKLPVNIKTENDLTIASNKGNVTIQAKGDNAELNMICQESRLTMKNGITTLKGKQVKTN